MKKAEKSKKLILSFAKTNKRLPSRKSEDVTERILAARMENYLSFKSASYDAEFRIMIFAKFPRKTNKKRTHDKKGRVAELKAFISDNGRLPFSHSFVGIRMPNEKLIRAILDNYASPCSSMFDSELYDFVLKADPHYGNKGIAIAKRVKI